MGWRSRMAAKGLAVSSIDFFGEGSVSSLRVGTGADRVLPYRLLEVFEGERQTGSTFSAQFLLQVITMHQCVGWTTAGKKKMPVAGPSNQISGDSSVD